MSFNFSTTLSLLSLFLSVLYNYSSWTFFPYPFGEETTSFHFCTDIFSHVLTSSCRSSACSFDVLISLVRFPRHLSYAARSSLAPLWCSYSLSLALQEVDFTYTWWITLHVSGRSCVRLSCMLLVVIHYCSLERPL